MNQINCYQIIETKLIVSPKCRNQNGVSTYKILWFTFHEHLGKINICVGSS